MKKVRAKKHLGQHFLTQPGIADDIANGIADKDGVKNVLEIGPGSGILTRAIMAREGFNLKLRRKSVHPLWEFSLQYLLADSIPNSREQGVDSGNGRDVSKRSR